MSLLKPNRLSKEKSPYLLQHAHNPVDWYPWGPEAFAKAKEENKPILVSIGYSTCHWCHVMERESFENEEIASVMNQYLISIKVDREERPDVDKIYMTAVSAMTGQGGWPLNAFLTPDLQPFFGGTYFPPEPRGNHPSWKDVVQHIGKSWQSAEERQKMLDAGSHITASLKNYIQLSNASTIDSQWIEGGFESFQSTYDAARGGFSAAPKFPMPVYQYFLFRYGARTKNQEAWDMALTTLRAMARGGIYDHLGGGFARYSTDAFWHVPHFEKMLYDNAQLAGNFIAAFQITHDDEFKTVARETLDYIARDMTSPEGAFYSAEDADSAPHPSPLPRGEGAGEGKPQKKEGAFYIWEKSEITELLGTEVAEVFNFRYGVRDTGNAAQDPHGEFTNQNILYAAHPIPEVARHFKRTEPEIFEILAGARQKLFAARNQRPRPSLDDKVISAWNGLMISAFAQSANVFGAADDLIKAQRAAHFLQSNLYDPSKKLLYRRWRQGEKQASAIADDYAFVIQGLLDLYEADFDTGWLTFAQELCETFVTRFGDPHSGGFYMTAIDQDPHLILRLKEDQDNVEPAANSVMVMNFLRFSQFLDSPEYRTLAMKTLESYGTTLRDQPRALPAMLAALDAATHDAAQVVIVGDLAAPETRRLLEIVHREFVPHKMLVVLPGSGASGLLAKRLKELKQLEGRATVYLCENYTCRQPTTDPEIFRSQWQALRNSS